MRAPASGRLVFLLWIALGLLATGSNLTAQEEGAAQQRPGARPGGASDPTAEADYETLRKLLGLPPPAPAPTPPPVAEPTPEPVPAPAPALVEPVSTPSPAQPEPAIEKPGPPRTKPSAPAPKAPARTTKPAPKAPRPTIVEKPQPTPVVEEQDTEEKTGTTVETTLPATPPSTMPAALPVRRTDVPAAGTVLSSGNAEQWKQLLTPSIQWAMGRGATMKVIDATPSPIEPTRQRATERYHAQVKLASSKLSMENYVAGIPFPLVTTEDPDAAIKIVFNFEARLVVDDMDLRHSSCDTGSMSAEHGVRVEREYLSDHFRRLFYVSRLHNEPMPTWKTQEGFRYREMVAGLLEPFDLKGAGYTYARYLDPARQDDSWVYYPSSRRVRRLSTAQRSEGVFGTDIDLDSFAGYAGNPAWVDWKYLGKKTVMASLHAEKVPSTFEPPPADFFPDDVWEPRDVYIIVGTSRMPGNVFSRRVLYIDQEGLLIPYAELYDVKGGLWKSLVIMWRQDKKANPHAKRAVYDDVMAYNVGFSLFDMQLEHVTRCQSPSMDQPSEEGWYYNFGDEEGSGEDAFTVARLIGTAH